MAMIEANGAEYRLSRGELDDTSRLLVSSLTTYPRLGALYPSSYAIDAAALFGDAGRTTRDRCPCCSARRTVRETIGVPVEAAHRHRRDRLMEEVRSQLGDVRPERALAEENNSTTKRPPLPLSTPSPRRGTNVGGPGRRLPSTSYYAGRLFGTSTSAPTLPWVRPAIDPLVEPLTGFSLRVNRANRRRDWGRQFGAWSRRS